MSTKKPLAKQSLHHYRVNRQIDKKPDQQILFKILYGLITLLFSIFAAALPAVPLAQMVRAFRLFRKGRIINALSSLF